MLCPDDMEMQIRSELAAVELTIVTISDLAEILGEGVNTAGMVKWLCRAAPKGATIEYHALERRFVLRRSTEALADPQERGNGSAGTAATNHV